MSEKNGSYVTKQRELLLAYLRTVPGKHVTVSDICDYFSPNDAAIGQTTIYRQLDKLVDEGLVNKYTFDGGSPACFEYTAEDAHVGVGPCYHCKCVQCGKLIHLHCDDIQELQTHLLEHHGFRMSPVRTVFYGLCETCD